MHASYFSSANIPGLNLRLFRRRNCILLRGKIKHGDQHTASHIAPTRCKQTDWIETSTKQPLRRPDHCGETCHSRARSPLPPPYRPHAEPDQTTEKELGPSKIPTYTSLMCLVGREWSAVCICVHKDLRVRPNGLSVCTILQRTVDNGSVAGKKDG